jgi:cytochrome P450 family 142 subfamily A polypeptide 1
MTDALELNLLDGAWHDADAHAVWAQLRREAPVHYDPQGDVWGISKYHDILAVEKDPATFSSFRAPAPHGMHLPMMISMDDPEHQCRRGLVSRGFTPKRVADHEPMLREVCNRIIDKVCEKGSTDFVWDIAAPLPLIMIAHLLGFEEEMHDDLLRWSESLVEPVEGRSVEDGMAHAAAVTMEFAEAQLALVADRRANPRDDVLTTLCQAEIDGERLDDASLVQESLLILIGGDETTRHVLSAGMLALIENPDQSEALRSGRADMATAVEEMIRWASPVQAMGRTVTRDVEFRGHTMTEGQQLALFYPSGNRDEDVFADPQRFDVTRTPNPHVAFGFGTHFCLGASLARLECRVMFRELLRRLPDIRLASGATLHRRPSNFVSGLESMPVTFTPTAPEGTSHG